MSKQYLIRVKIFSKKNSHPLETICVYSGQDQFDVLNGKTYSSNNKENVVWSNIELPSRQDNFAMFENLPEYLKFRSNTPKKDMIANARNILWQSINNRENREDAQLSRMFEVSIPSFFSTDIASSLLRKFASTLVENGMIADCSLHSRQNSLNISLLDRIKTLKNGTEEKVENSTITSDYQGYIICPLRSYANGQFSNKQREWNQPAKLGEWRQTWLEILAHSLYTNDIEAEDIITWEDKLSIYSEYEGIKEKTLQSLQPNNFNKIKIRI